MTFTPARIKNFILDLLFPKSCVSCRKEGAFICPPCSLALSVRAPSCLLCGKRDLRGKNCALCRKKTGISRFFAPFSYKNEVVRNLIHLCKYERAKDLVPALAGFMTEGLLRAEFTPKRNMIFVPVPLHPRRGRERGFNQSELLALALGEKFGVPVMPRVMVRTRNTKPQIEMEKDSMRHDNVHGAFTIPAGAVPNLNKKTVILVDDITTSGATLIEAARILKKAGVRSVWAVTVARR